MRHRIVARFHATRVPVVRVSAEWGQGTVEYALILALLSVAAVGAVGGFGGSLRDFTQAIERAITAAFPFPPA
ncbi:MAG: hypothetical protein HYY04_13100 [Chloroflexi bacterium]|nr:hypothetical protein [Chloroflexota bacterium]